MAFSEQVINQITAYQPELVAFLARKTSLAEDIAQDVMVLALEEAKKRRRPPADIPAYLQAMAMKILRAEKNKSALSSNFSEKSGLKKRQSSESDPEKKHLPQDVYEQLAKLGEKYLLISVLHFEDKWRAKKIAAELLMPYEEVKDRIFCIQKRRDSLKESAPHPRTRPANGSGTILIDHPLSCKICSWKRRNR